MTIILCVLSTVKREGSGIIVLFVFTLMIEKKRYVYIIMIIMINHIYIALFITFKVTLQTALTKPYPLYSLSSI